MSNKFAAMRPYEGFTPSAGYSDEFLIGNTMFEFCIPWTGYENLPLDARIPFQGVINQFKKQQKKHTLNILVMGKSCVGKTSTVKSIVQQKFSMTRYEKFLLPEWISFKREDFTLNIVDTTPLACVDGFENMSSLELITGFLSETFFDVILYVDRADVYSMTATDLVLANTITELFGKEAWNRVLIVLTHCNALKDTTGKDFHKRRKAELLKWILKGGDVEENVQVALQDRVVFIDDPKKHEEGKSLEIHDDDLRIVTLIEKIACIAIDIRAPYLKVQHPFMDIYETFFSKILANCKVKYIEMIKHVDNHADNPEGEGHWKSLDFDRIKLDTSYLISTFVPEDWKIDHFPASAATFIQNVKAKPGGTFTILVMGRGGVGKSTIANSIIGRNVFPVNKTKGSHEILLWSGSASSITLRFIEIPGFVHFDCAHSGYFDAIEELWSLCSVNALLYVDRMDDFGRDDTQGLTLSDIALFFGPTISHRTLIVLTHGESSSQELFETQSERTKVRMNSDWIHLFDCQQNEAFRIKAVVVDNCAKDKISLEESNWAAQLFAGLNEICELERDPAEFLEDVRRDRLLLTEFEDEDFTSELEGNIRMILLHTKKTSGGQMDPEDLPENQKLRLL